MSLDLTRPRFSCGCFLCAPPRRQPTDRDRLIAELDRLGIPHNLHEPLVPPPETD